MNKDKKTVIDTVNAGMALNVTHEAVRERANEVANEIKEAKNYSSHRKNPTLNDTLELAKSIEKIRKEDSE